MQTLRVDIINNKALKFLQNLERLRLIHVHKEKNDSTPLVDWSKKYKGAMTKQTLTDIDDQLNELRNRWE